MRKTVLPGIMVMAALVVGSLVSAASVPQLMNYQGRLNDSGGAPVSGTKVMIFSLYSSATATAALWTETQSVDLSNGSFSSVLGSFTPLPTSLFDNAEVWLGIAVGGDPEMTPRQQITSVGYAMRSGTADLVTAGVYSTGTYANPSWITSLAGSKITGLLQGGDLSGSLVYPTVAAIQGRPVMSVAPTAGQGLLWNGTAWAPATITSSGSAGGDLSGSFPSPKVSKINGNAVPANAFGYLTNDGTGTLSWSLPNLSGLSGVLPLTSGGTGTTTASGALMNLGAVNKTGDTMTGPFAGTVSAVTGTAGSFILSNLTNTFPALYAATSGSGPAAQFAGNVIASGLVTAGTVSAASYYGNGSNLTGISAASVVNGVYTTGNYADPSWIMSLSGNKISGNISGNAAGVTGILPIASGGTGTTTASGALVNLGAVNSAGDTMTGALTVPALTTTGNIVLPATTTTTGVIRSGTDILVHTYSSVPGSNNFFAGQNAGNLSTSGHDNAAVGGRALNANTTGFQNTAIGKEALVATTSGDSNTGSGYQVLSSNTTGGGNTAFGQTALFHNTTGNYNTAIGYFADVSTGNLTNATAIGYNAVVGQSNSIVLGGTGANAVKVGIGTQTPTQTLDVVGTVKATAFSGSGAGLTNLPASSMTGSVPDASLSMNVALLNGSQTITGLRTFSPTGSSAPFAVDATKTAAVSYLNADMLDGYHASDFLRTTGGTLSGTLTLSNGNLDLPGSSLSGGAITQVGTRVLHMFQGGFFAGQNAGNFTMTGARNTGIGWTALYNNAGGRDNAGVGYVALFNNTDGYENTAIGASALMSNDTGYDNTAAGYKALFSNSLGVSNTAAGADALYSNIDGSANSALGRNALYYNTSGYWNTALGLSALYANTTGYWNTATGAEALYVNTTGNNNVANGTHALYANTAGWGNTASGTEALANNTTASLNTADGYRALYHNTTGNYNTASGYGALEMNTTGLLNTAFGSGTLAGNTTASMNTAIGYNALTSASANGNTAIGYGAGPTSTGLSNTTSIGANAVADASNHVRIGDTTVTQIGGQVAWSNLSDLRSKKDIEDIRYGLGFIRSIRPVQYKMKQGNNRYDFGFIAQEVEFLVGDDYNILGIGGDEDRTLSLRYTDFIAPMVKAIQEQQNMIEAQKAEIESLKAEVAAIKAMLTGK